MSAALLLLHGLLAWGLIPGAGLSSALFAPAILAILVLVPGAHWVRWLRSDPCSPSRFVGQAILLGFGHLLLCTQLLALAGVDLRMGGRVLAVAAGIPVLLARRSTHRRASRPTLRGEDAATSAVALTLAVAMAALPAALRLGSDVPAHLGAIVDALAQGRWLVADHSYPGASGGTDPRFGLAHGIYAALAQMSGSTPREVFARLPILMAPLAFLARQQLFRALGAPAAVSVLGAAVFALTDGDGRGYALWSAAYPGHLGLTVALLACATLLQESSREESRDTASIRWRFAVGVAWAMTARMHPFGWWITVSWMGVWGVLFRGRRGAGTTVWVPLLAGVLGGLLLLPTLLGRGTAPLHSLPTDVLFVTGDWFVVDPLSFARWSSTSTFFALLAVPLLPARIRPPLLAAALVVVLYSFVPWSTTALWDWFSYLLVRTGRVLPSVLVLLLGVTSIHTWWSSGSRIRAIALAALCVLGLVQEARAVRWLLRGDSPTRVARVETSLDEIAATFEVRNAGIPLCSPRIAHGLRARVGGRAWAIPVAHASPEDASIRQRLDRLRDVFSPYSSYDRVREALVTIGARRLLTVDTVSRFEDFAFVTDPNWEATLASRLLDLGVPVKAQGPGWTIFDVSALPSSGWSAPTVLDAPPRGQSTPLSVQGAPFSIVSSAIEDSVSSPGSRIRVRLWYRSAPSDDGPVPWEEVSVGFERDSSALPRALAPVAKPIRKLVVERRGKSPGRWGRSWIPFDGGVDWGVATTELRSEVIEIPVPSYAAAGNYRAWIRVRPKTWRVQRRWSDYLRDDREDAHPLSATLRVRATGARAGAS